MSADTGHADLKKTPLHAMHLELGARMVPFAGYDMPVQYPTGVLAEHRHTREAAGLFDVSHMGQVRITGPDPARAFERLVPVDVVDLAPGQQRYALFLNETGGILDDLMVACLDPQTLHVVVNAACRAQDIELMKTALASDCQVEELCDAALVALQGPKAVDVLARLNPQVKSLVFMQVARLKLGRSECIVSRSGYTGEDGFEISVPAAEVESLARELLAQPELRPIGLGARDSLRLEAGLCLYGHDIDQGTTPVEAGLAWALSKARREGGTRPLGYPGAQVIARQLKEGVQRRRVGLKGLDRTPVREGALLFAQAQGGDSIGKVTSGAPGPTVGAPVAMGYVPAQMNAPGTPVWAEVRGKRIAMEIVKTPFVEPGYHRG